MLDHKHILVVHGLAGLDEFSLLGESRVAEVIDGKISEYSVTPEELGLKRCKIDDIAPGDPKYNAKTIREIFEGVERGPKRDVVVLNAAGAFVVGGKVQKLKEGAEYAQKVIDDGRALKKLNELVRVSQEMKKKD